MLHWVDYSVRKFFTGFINAAFILELSYYS